MLGPALPEEAFDKDSEIIVSNEESLYYINTWDNVIYKLVCSETITDCSWRKLDQKLEFHRWGAIALMLPESLEDTIACTRMIVHE